MGTNKEAERPDSEKELMKESICYGSTGPQGVVQKPLDDGGDIRSIPFGSTGPQPSQTDSDSGGSNQSSTPPPPPAGQEEGEG